MPANKFDQSKSDIEEIEGVKEIEPVKDTEPVKQDQTAIYIGLGIVAIIGCGVYCRYFMKPKEKVKSVKSGESVKPKEKVELVKSGIVNME